MKRWFHYVSIMFLYVTLGIMVVMMTPFIVALVILQNLSSALSEACETAVVGMSDLMAIGRRTLGQHFEELFEQEENS